MYKAIANGRFGMRKSDPRQDGLDHCRDDHRPVRRRWMEKPRQYHWPIVAPIITERSGRGRREGDPRYQQGERSRSWRSKFALDQHPIVAVDRRPGGTITYVERQVLAIINIPITNCWTESSLSSLPATTQRIFQQCTIAIARWPVGHWPRLRTSAKDGADLLGDTTIVPFLVRKANRDST